MTLVLLMLGAARVMEERLLFSPPSDPSPRDATAEQVSYAASDGQLLYGFAVGGDSATRSGPVVIVFHGHAESAHSLLPWAREAAERTGVRMFLAEYRGYGRLNGVSSTSTIDLDARAAVRGATGHFGIDAGEIILYARGLGSAAAVSVAVQRRVRAVLLEAPMASMRSFERRVLTPPMSWLVAMVSPNALNPRRLIARVSGPVWVTAGGRDDAVPVDVARSMHDAALVKGEFLVVNDAAHGEIAAQGGAEYWAWFTRALERATSDN